jgi:hypothetical protein
MANDVGGSVRLDGRDRPSFLIYAFKLVWTLFLMEITPLSTKRYGVKD